jgi:cobalt/nickel transport system permease protein
MHIPDGFLSPAVWLTLDAVSVPAVGWVARSAKTSQNATLVGVMGAFVFAAQMINVPIGFGASSHLLGGALLTALLGPLRASLTLTAVVILQAILFQDGGILALGPNIFNMAFFGVMAAYLPLALFGHNSVSMFCAGVLSVLTTGALVLAELALSGVSISGGSLYAAVTLLVITAALEGAISVAAVRLLHQRHAPHPVGPRVRRAAIATVLLATTAAVIASTAPDLFQQFASNTGLASTPWWSPMPGYQMSGLGPVWLQKPVASLLGVACVYAVCVGWQRKVR